MLFLIKKFLLKNRVDEKVSLSESESSFLKLLGNGLKRGSITSLGDIEKIYFGSIGFKKNNNDYRVHLAQLLHKHYALIVSGVEDAFERVYSKDINKDGLPREIESRIKEILETAIHENNKVAPFSFLKKNEEELLTDIRKYGEVGDQATLEHKINTLASIMHVKNNEFVRLEKINRWSVILTIAGTFLTIIFGLL